MVAYILCYNQETQRANRNCTKVGDLAIGNELYFPINQNLIYLALMVGKQFGDENRKGFYPNVPKNGHRRWWLGKSLGVYKLWEIRPTNPS